MAEGMPLAFSLAVVAFAWVLGRMLLATPWEQFRRLTAR